MPPCKGVNQETLRQFRLEQLARGAGAREQLHEVALDLGRERRRREVAPEDGGVREDGLELARIARGIVPDDALQLRLQLVLERIGADFHRRARVVDRQEIAHPARDRERNRDERKNIQGDIIGIINNSGSIVAKYVYDAWGNHTVYTGTGSVDTTTTSVGNMNPFRYRSYYYDTETEYYYLKTRYYVPKIGRFLNLDSFEYLDQEVINGLNLYAYCLNNPVMYSDGSGHFPILACILGITALAGLGLTIGGVASDNSVLKSIGLTMVAVPALISGGIAIAAGIAGATLTGIVGSYSCSRTWNSNVCNRRIPANDYW